MVGADVVDRGSLRVNQATQFLRRKYKLRRQRVKLNRFHFLSAQLCRHLQSLD